LLNILIIGFGPTVDLLTILGFGPDGWGLQFLSGLAITVQVAVFALPIGLAVGIVVALANRGTCRILRGAANLYTSVFRGTPEILTLFALYHGGSQALAALGRSLGAEAEWSMPGIVAGAIALGLVFSAYAAEVWRGALAGVAPGQTEAAMALGLSRTATLILVVLPQAFRIALPGLGNLWLVLLKDTALVSVIAVPDLMRHINLAVQATRQPFGLYLFACAVYVALTLVSVQVLRRLSADPSDVGRMPMTR
jgi:polar amino acid transport system permease protein